MTKRKTTSFSGEVGNITVKYTKKFKSNYFLHFYEFSLILNASKRIFLYIHDVINFSYRTLQVIAFKS